MAIDDQTLEKLADLSMLNLDSGSKSLLRDDLEDILKLINALEQVDTHDIPPLHSPLDLCQRLRKDQVSEKADPAYYQQGVNRKENNLYLVPKVIE
jgi:aspartyl-tRNA(Asn)/glutamyl-tRNA(Gln) amidotransferase subunit C